MQGRSHTHMELCGSQLMLHILGKHEYNKPLSLSHQKTTLMGSTGPPESSYSTSPSLS